MPKGNKKCETKEYLFIHKQVAELKNECSAVSISSYSHNIYHLYRHLEDKNTPNLNNFLFRVYDPAFDLPYKRLIIQETKNNNTKRNKLNALQVWFGDRVPTWIVSMRDDINDKYNQAVITDPKPCKCKWTDILSIRRRIDLDVKNQKLRSRHRDNELLPDAQRKLLVDCVLWGLYTEAPLRNDFNLYYNPTKIHPNQLAEKYAGILPQCAEPQKYNWFSPNVKNAQIVINEFKTNKTYEPIVFTPSKQLFNDLNSIYQQNSRHNQLLEGGFALALSTGDKYKVATKNDISRILYSISKRYSPKKIGIRSSDIRHIYLTDKYKKTKDDSNADAKLMGHSVATQQKIYVQKEAL